MYTSIYSLPLPFYDLQKTEKFNLVKVGGYISIYIYAYKYKYTRVKKSFQFIRFISYKVCTGLITSLYLTQYKKYNVDITISYKDFGINAESVLNLSIECQP